ncbi:MotA/TolQ/ExbB proton channel family protein [Hyphomicrobiales bacterium]|jgi:biopolymer transport protein ExbB/TolQ|nr:MotA/TolQ/ExbB proton channel family protein [Hyphomicrobiales bacterium]|tara:strand:+ start:1496 stop:2128 length:633 start_codon:yes stop_codon:yes gene_type:complete
MKLNAQNHSLGVLRSLLLLVLIIFGVWILDERGLVAVVIEGDKSQISKVIAGLWIVSSIYWLYLSKIISEERNSFENMEFNNKKLLVSRFFNSLEKNENKDVLINAFESEFEKKISYGVIASDIALKLGLLGTIIGFILMLKPIADLNSTSPENLKIALSSMSSGMAVALYTTLTGLIISTLIRIQFHFSATLIISLLNDLAFYTENNLE